VCVRFLDFLLLESCIRVLLRRMKCEKYFRCYVLWTHRYVFLVTSEVVVISSFEPFILFYCNSLHAVRVKLYCMKNVG
jgi:hypothetical protein